MRRTHYIQALWPFGTDVPPPTSCFIHPGIEGGFDVEQDQYEEDIKVVILPDRQEVTSEDLSSMPDVVRDRVRFTSASSEYHLVTILQDTPKMEALLTSVRASVLIQMICVPVQVSQSMAGIVAADSVSHTLQVQQWDGEVRQESKHAADLKQLDNGVKIPPRWDTVPL